MNVKCFIFLILMLAGVHSHAQHCNLQLILRNNHGTPVLQATVAAYELPAHKHIKTTIISGDGNVLLEGNSNYELNISSAGFRDTSVTIKTIEDNMSLLIVLKEDIANLGNVTVVSKRPLMKQEDDKTIVDAETLANSSTNAYEVLEKTPGTVVDQDGNVYLTSTTPATIQINGREMKLSSADLASLLKSLPAGSVSKIEILRTPSAKYDASGSGGILNIVLKKGVRIGTSGSANAGYFQGKYATQTFGVNLNRSAGKINSFFSYQFTNRNNFESLRSTRLIPTDTTLLSQDSYTTYPTKNHYLSAGIDIAATSKWNFGYDLRISRNNGNSYALNKIDIKDGQQAKIAENESAIENDNRSFYAGNNLSAKHKIDTLGSEWITQLDYNYYRNDNEQQYENRYFNPTRPGILGDGKNDNDKHMFVGQTDIVFKRIKNYTFEAGFKATISKSDNSSEYFKDTGNNIKFVDTYQTNTFKYRETISAAYLQVATTFFGFTCKPGVRLETTDIRGNQTIPADTSFSIKRTDLFPYIYIRHKLFKVFGFPLVGSAVYRKSIRRPYYETLNPYPKYIDQYLFDVGNPRLKPQFSTNYELNATYNDIPVFAIGINKTKDIFSNVTYQDNLTKIAYRTYDNLGRNTEYYFKIIGGIPPGSGRYFFYVGAQYNYNIYKGIYQGNPLNYERGSWLFFMYQQLKITSTLTADMQGFMRSKGLQNLYELNTFGGLYFSVNKSILKKKANIIVSVNDVLRTNKVSFTLNQGDVRAEGDRINDTRRIGITLRYNFGIKPKEENKASFDVPANIN